METYATERLTIDALKALEMIHPCTGLLLNSNIIKTFYGVRRDQHVRINICHASQSVPDSHRIFSIVL